MGKKLFTTQIIGFVVVGITGTFAHFLFELTSGSVLAGLFTPVNESVWEHLKLLFFPFLFFSVAEFFILGKPPGFFTAQFKGAVAGMAFIVAFFYTYSGILGKNVMLFDVLSFFLGVFAAFFTSYTLIKNGVGKKHRSNRLGIILFALAGMAFFLFTFCPPFLEIFKDPQSLSYGI
ncbi:MAG: DUF6512 family protein [Clostridiales bacterium]|nr:DUF6512 family protein [Clostridiales bacterium]